MGRIFKKIVHSLTLYSRLNMYRSLSQYVDLPSALYIPNEMKSKLFVPLDPYIDLHTFRCLEKLKSDLSDRNMNVDIDYLYEESFKYENVIHSHKTIREKLNKLKLELERVTKEGESANSGNEIEFKEGESANSGNEIEFMKLQIEDTTNNLDEVNNQYRKLVDSFILPYLQLPNSLHKNTSRHDECLFSLFPVPQFKFPVKSHVEIGSINDELDIRDVSPTSYYLKKYLAVVELAVSDFVMYRFREHDFKSYAGLDITKAVLAEGCGLKLKGNSNLLQIENKKCLAFNQEKFLFGSASLLSFVGGLCKGMIAFQDDPLIRLVTVGRIYRLNNGKEILEKSLFNCLQSTSVSAYVVYSKEEDEEALVNEIAMLINQTYTELGLHFKLIQYGAIKLRSYESLAVGVCMYSPYLKRYVEVGRISLIEDFISKRLQIYQILGKKKATFLGMIYVEVMDVKNWIACALENTQTEEGNYCMPNCLKSFELG